MELPTVFERDKRFSSEEIFEYYSDDGYLESGSEERNKLLNAIINNNVVKFVYCQTIILLLVDRVDDEIS